jgi:hypothetical protein
MGYEYAVALIILVIGGAGVSYLRQIAGHVAEMRADLDMVRDILQEQYPARDKYDF